MQYHYIAIEGNIGAGKTTLAELLSKHYNARLILEEFADNTFLPKFYDDPKRYAFPLELSFLADRYKQLEQMLTEQDLFRQITISDYTFIKSKLFASINLEADEYNLFQKLFDIIDLQLPSPDLLIYLQAPVNLLQQHIQTRGRTYEQNISNQYLQKVSKAYHEHFLKDDQPVLVVDTERIDFLNNPLQFNRLIDFLNSGPIVGRFELFENNNNALT